MKSLRVRPFHQVLLFCPLSSSPLLSLALARTHTCADRQTVTAAHTPTDRRSEQEDCVRRRVRPPIRLLWAASVLVVVSVQCSLPALRSNFTLHGEHGIFLASVPERASLQNMSHYAMKNSIYIKPRNSCGECDLFQVFLCCTIRQ